MRQLLEGMFSTGAPVLALVAVSTLIACRQEEVLFRPSCEVCHMPLGDDGRPHGIEEAHSFAHLECVDCHGGDPQAYNQAAAHVSAGGGPSYLRNLSPRVLDGVDPEYLRFINPGDLRVADISCGSGSGASKGSGCHQTTVDKVKRSMMAHTSGEVTVARYRAGAQGEPLGELGATALVDKDFDPDLPTVVPSLEQFGPPAPDLTITPPSIAELQDEYMVKSCFRCHLWDFGENKFAADFRSSGCTACHMAYSDLGLSESEDPTIPKEVPPHPKKHELTSKITVEQCTHCHYRGGRIGISFRGYREGAGSGFNPENGLVLGVTQHGHDGSFYVVDEDTTNEYDETPPDIHFEYGMHCIDCHTEHDVHGDGHLYSDTQVIVEVRCTSCHGTIDEESDLLTARGIPMPNVFRDEKGDVWLEGKVDGELRPVTQIARLVQGGTNFHSLEAERSMGRNEKTGFSHTDTLACHTCHSAWIPSCYGCHVTIDFQFDSRLQTTGENRVGQPAGQRKWVTVDDLVLMHGPKGLIGPSMPSERFFMSAVGPNGEVLLDRAVRRDAQGRPGFGQRTFQPHTVRSQTRFSQCESCHINGDRSNEDRIRLAVGFGTERFIETDGEGNSYRMDATQTEEYESLVTVGHPEPEESRPLDRSIAEKLLNEPVE